MTPPDNRRGVRTWVIWRSTRPGLNVRAIEGAQVNGAERYLTSQENITVAELEPVLDLLERCAKAIDVKPSGQPWRTRLDVDRFLAAHNRGQSQGHCPHCGLEHMGALAEQACRDRAIEAAS